MRYIQLIRLYAINSVGVEFAVVMDSDVIVDEDDLYRRFFEAVNEGAFLEDTSLRIDQGEVCQKNYY